MKINLLLATLAIAVASLLGLPAQKAVEAAVVCGAGDAEWDGGAGTDSWHDAANWVGDTVPAPNDDVCIPDQTPDVTVTVSKTGTTTVNSLKSDEAIHKSGIGTLAINSASQINNALTLSGGTLNGSGSLTVGGLLTWTGFSNFTTMSGTGTTTAAGGMRLNNNSTNLLERTLINPAGQTATWLDGRIDIRTGGTFDNLGAFNAEHTGIGDIAGSGGEFNNSGTFTKSVGSGITTIIAPFNNNGPLNVTTGTVRLLGGSTSTGAYNVSAGATLEFSAGTHTLDASSSVAGAGTVRFIGVTVNINGTYNVTGESQFAGATVTFNPASTLTSLGSGPLTVSAGTVTFNSGENINVTTLTLSGGTITGTDDITASGLFTWHGFVSTMSGGGTTTANGGILFDTNNSKFLGRTLTNAAGQTATWLNGNIFIEAGGTIDNQGTFEAQHTGTFRTGRISGGVGREFNNSGTFTKSVDTSVTTIAAPFNNTNTTNVQTGSLTLQGGSTSTGTYNISPGGILSFQGGSTSTGAYNVSAGATLGFFSGAHALNAGSSVAGAGTVRLAGTVNINGTYNITGETQFIGSTVTFNPASTLTSLGVATVLGGTVTFNSGENVTVTTLTQSGGTITGADDITASGLFTWSGGTHGGTGTTTANGGISITTFSNKTLDGRRTLTNPAGQTATMSGSGFLMAVFATFNNEGTFDAQQTAVSGIQGGALNNSGTFIKSEDGAIVIAANFNNTGSLDVQKRTLLLFRTASATGAYNVSAGATLEFANAAHTLNAGSTVAGLGTVRFNTVPSFPGTVNINGTYNVTGTTEFTSGNVNFNPSSTLTSLGSGPLSVSGGTVTFNSGESPINVTTLDLSGGTIAGSDSITASGLFTWTGSSTMSGTGATTANAGMILNSDSTMFLGRTLTNPVGQTTGWLDGDIDIRDGGTFNNVGTFDAQNDGTMSSSGTGSNTFNNLGTVVKSAGAGGAAKTQIDTPYTNTGTTRVQNGTLRFNGTYTQTAGATIVDAGATLESLLDININGGIIGGAGTIVGNVNITGGGAAAPGLSTGVLTITGDYTQTATGALNIEIGGLTAGEDYDQLVVNGAASLAGTLNVTLINAFVPEVGDSFLILNGTTTTGSFDTVNLPAGGGLDPGQLVVGAAASGVCGDLNDDDAVNVFDAITTLQIIVGLVDPTTAQLVLADLNRDGDINVFDAITLLQIIVGLTQVSECGPIAS